MSGMMGLNIGVNALKAHRRALDVTAHNIANANTEGYTRQRAVLSTTIPYTLPSMNNRKEAGQVGTGVEVSQILRLRNAFVDKRLHDNTSSKSEWEQRSNALNEIELIFGEPSDAGLRSSLDNFWSSLQELQNSPENSAVRAAVRQSAASLTDIFSSLRGQLNDFRWSLDGHIKNKVGEINSISHRIADLNQQISQASSKGDSPNDLLDKRDLLIDELSKIVDIEVYVDSRSKANVMIGGYSLVSGNTYNELEIHSNSNRDGLVDIKWAKSGEYLKVQSGEIAGLLDARDNKVAYYVNELDTMAQVFIAKFNTIHQKGYGLDNSTGISFFEGTNASNIKVSDAIMDEINGLNKIAAASQLDSVGDGSNALNLSQVMQNGVLNGNNSTMGDYWGGIISSLGIDTQRSKGMTDNFDSITQQLEQQRASLSGVSLDEEMANIIVFQQAYNAAAKLIQTQSEMMDVLNGILR
ncbi:MAG: flagellar hook-associated protein FlgK [Halanaerobiales bacterium]|nr:flagellar hook-associated protein FlgK [Halanaerobiales bacterium]